MRLPALQRSWSKAVHSTVFRAALAVVLAQRFALRLKQRPRACAVSEKQRAQSVAELRARVPPPRPHLLGGERIGTDTYERFLSIVGWDSDRAAPLLEADLRWRAEVQPRARRPEDMPRACAQRGWTVMMRPITGGSSEPPSVAPQRALLPPSAPAPEEPPRLDVPMPLAPDAPELEQRWHHMMHGVPWYTGCLLLGPWLRDALPGSVARLSDSVSQARENLISRAREGRVTGARWRGRALRQTLHPPHHKPPFMQWRYTRHGLPITLIQVRDWFPERCGRHEARGAARTHSAPRGRMVDGGAITAQVMMHTAYMMEHYIRRMPSRNGKRVQRACLLMDMRGFRAATLPYVRECINVLRRHYPGRLGVACFFHVPPYFVPVWNIIKPRRRTPKRRPPLLDEEIMHKTHFLPASVRDVEGAIRWCNQRDLPAF